MENSYAENKVIICISNGCPFYNANYNDMYFSPISTQDTHNTARKIEKDGIKVIG